MSRPARVLCFGRNGQVARALQDTLAGEGVELVVLGRPEVDLLAPDTAARAVEIHRPSLVVLPAAYTAVDRAEDEAEKARVINALAPAAIAAAAARIGAPIIHFSTDYVFDGTKSSPYVEEDPMNPLGVYGATKRAGEYGVARHNPQHVILRTAWVCSATGSNFVKTILRLAAERPALRVVADQYGAPTFATDLARAVAEISRKLHAGEAAGGARWGVFHLASHGLTTWHGLAEAIIEGAVRRGGRSVPVEPIATADYPTRARRPAYSKLATARIEQAYGIEMPHWRTGLDVCLDALLGPARVPGNLRRDGYAAGDLL